MQMEMQRSRERIEWIDMAKGYGILFVILGHLPVGSLEFWINTFHMPLFFFLAGYVFREGDSFRVFLKKKVKGLIVPYFFLGSVIVLYEVLISIWKDYFSAKTVVGFVLDILCQKRAWTIWFLAVLFLMNLLFYWMVRLVRRPGLLCLTSVILAAMGLLYYKLGGGILPWNMDVVCPAMPFMAAGYVLAKYEVHWEKLFRRKGMGLLLTVICVALAAVLEWMSYQISGAGLWMFHSIYGAPLCTYPAGILGTIAVCILARMFVCGPIRYLGENTLVYFGWHQAIMIPLSSIFLNKMGFYLLDTSSTQFRVNFVLGMFVIIVVVLSFCNLILTKTKLKFFLGKW